MCGRQLENGLEQLAALSTKLQEKPTFLALQAIMQQHDPGICEQLHWQNLIEDGWETVQRADVIQTWLAHGDALDPAFPASRQHVPAYTGTLAYS